MAGPNWEIRDPEAVRIHPPALYSTLTLQALAR